MANKMRLGELLVAEDIVEQDAVDDALRVQVAGNRRLGNILVRMGKLSSDTLAATLSRQLGKPLTDIDAVFESGVKNILPRYLCRKYDALPLALKDNNILLTAMTDPSDSEAISDLEDYTGKVIEPCLAKQSDIAKAISGRISYSLKDLFNPQVNTRITRVIAIAALVLVVGLGLAGYKYVQSVKYGKIANLAHSTVYEHHDLMVGFDRSGSISFLGHSAFSDGYYSVSFSDINALRSFIVDKKDDFSVRQYKWLQYVMNREDRHHLITTGLARNGK
ncbi:GspE/PulE/PilB domain-containing protein [Desulfomarina sp.]